MRPVLLVVTVAWLAAAPVPWHLDRIDQRGQPLDNRFGRTGTGTGVHVYVIDTGIRRTHVDFGGRADWIGDFTTGDAGRGDADDCDRPDSGGHGTHVASILSGTRFGVAPGATVHALRILPCNGTTRTDFDAAIRAVRWITAHGQRPAVVNISPARWDTNNTQLDDAIRGSLKAGFVYVLSAGGVGNIASYSPQRVAEAVKVAATDRADRTASSTYGPDLTLYAPGIAVEAAGNRSDDATFSGDGDSYAAPVVAGIAALYLEAHPNATPEQVKTAIVTAATPDVVVGAGRSPNRLAHLIDPPAR